MRSSATVCALEPTGNPQRTPACDGGGTTPVWNDQANDCCDSTLLLAVPVALPAAAGDRDDHSRDHGRGRGVAAGNWQLCLVGVERRQQTEAVLVVAGVSAVSGRISQPLCSVIVSNWQAG